MKEWLMAVEWNLLVCVCGLAIDIEIEITIGIVDDSHFEHGDAAVFFNFFGPFNVRVD